MKHALIGFLIFASTSVVAQEDAVSSDSIIDGLIGDETTRAILVRERRGPEGMSIPLTIEFEFNSGELTDEATRQLKQLRDALVNEKLMPYAFNLVGHTDGRGDADYNDKLSMKRAKKVQDFLLAQGVAEERLSVDGKGEQELLYPHLPDDSRNRRVEIINLGETKTAP